MAVIKLTDNVWLAQEATRVEGVLRSNRALGGKEGKAGRDSSTLKAMINYAGLDYENADLLAIKNKLIADGVIEETGSAMMMPLSESEPEPQVDQDVAEVQEPAEVEPRGGWASRLVNGIKEKFGR